MPDLSIKPHFGLSEGHLSNDQLSAAQAVIMDTMSNNIPNKQTRQSVRFHEVDDDLAGQRIDNFLLTYLKGVPKSLVYRIVRKGEVRVNKGRVKPEYKLQAGDVVRIPPVNLDAQKAPPKPSHQLAEQLSQAVVFENDGLLVVNKPSGLAVHGGSGVSLGLIETLRQIRPNERFLELVHRLDRDTSGCVMVAKSRRYLRFLQDELRARRVDKSYLALVHGQWSKRRKSVDIPLLRAELPNGERVVRAVAEGTDGAKASLTHYRIQKVFDDCSLVAAKPVTGRTHQIRVHCLHAGHVILGDPKYAARELLQAFKPFKLNRLFLHAHQLKLRLPDGEKLAIEAPLASELQVVLDNLRKRQ